MADGGKKPSFFETVPGVITAIAALITAVATLITALNSCEKKAEVRPDAAPQQKNTTIVQIPAAEFANSIKVLDGFSLKNTSQKLNNGNWEWTAYIAGPVDYQQQIKLVTYFLHPSLNPNVVQGDSSKLGHPVTGVSWGVFILKAEVVLSNGTSRTYEHMLRVH